ncbi:MAG: hypothetical protein SFV24_21390 [Gemmatimonadales bacterium]|nr:hypothetical protein [Gemmatimonadales bacterium]
MHAIFAIGIALQAPVLIAPAIACAACRLDRTVLTTLDTNEAARPSALVKVGRELLLVPDAGAPLPIKRFEIRTGRFLGTVGRQGRGPGEFWWPQFLAAMPGDSLFVFDYSTLQHSVLAPATYRYVRGAPVTVSRPSGAVLPGPNGPLWVAAAVAPPKQVGYPFHLFELDGRWLRSVGAERPFLAWNNHLAFAKRLAVGPNATVWAVSRYGPMTIDVFDRSGRRLHAARYAPPWLPELTRPQQVGDPPLPERVPIWVKSSTELLVATLVPAVDWQTGIVKADDPTHGPGTPVVGDISRLFDTVVEWLDVPNGRVVFRARVDEAVVAILDDGLVALYREGVNGIPLLTIERWQLRETADAPRRTP